MLIIGIGAAAIGMILGMRNLVVPRHAGDLDLQAPGHDQFFYLTTRSPKTRLQVLAKLPSGGNRGFQQRHHRMAPEPEDEWQQGGLTPASIIETSSYDKLELFGQWPHDKIGRQHDRIQDACV